MPSERVAMILRAKSDFSEEQIQRMTDREGWEWIYNQRPKRTMEKLDEICFTGFSSSVKKQLQQKAKDAHLKVVTEVTKNLRYLCVGENAGPSKLKEVKDKQVILINQEQFMTMIERGELPSG